MKLIPYNSDQKIAGSRLKAINRAQIKARSIAKNIYNFQYSSSPEECLNSSRWADKNIRFDFLSFTKEKKATWKENSYSGVYAGDKEELFDMPHRESKPWQSSISPQKARTLGAFKAFWENHPKQNMGDPYRGLEELMSTLEYAWQHPPTRQEALQWIKEHSGFEPSEKIEHPVVLD